MSNVTTAASSSGVATATGVRQTNGMVQVSLANASGSGTATLTVRPVGSKTYESVVDGTISVGATTTVTINGWVNSVRATSDNSGDTFDLVVVG